MCTETTLTAHRIVEQNYFERSMSSKSGIGTTRLEEMRSCRIIIVTPLTALISLQVFRASRSREREERARRETS